MSYNISIIIPLYNEELVLDELFERIFQMLQNNFGSDVWEVICVDDGSRDTTSLRLLEFQKLYPALKVIKFSRNFGHHKAISAGLDYASGDYIVLMDGDLQDQPEEIPVLFSRLQEGYDVVYGVRKDKKFSFFKKLKSSLFITVMRWLMDEKIELNSSIFRIMKRSVLDKVILLREKNRFVLGLIGWVGFKTGSVEVNHGERKKGVTKYSFKKEIKLALDAICAFSDYPLRLISRIGFLLMAFSGFFASFLIARKLVWGVGLMGWTSVMCAILFTSGMHMLLLGVVGEYIGRIYVEVKNRPLYIVEAVVGFEKNEVVYEAVRECKPSQSESVSQPL